MTKTLEKMFEKLKQNIADTGLEISHETLAMIDSDIDQFKADLIKWAEKNAVDISKMHYDNHKECKCSGFKAVPLSLIRESLRSQRHEPQDEFKEVKG